MEHWCPYCCKLRVVQRIDPGFICCIACGKIVADALFFDEPGSANDDALSVVQSLQTDIPDSIETRLNHATVVISEMVDQLGFCDGDQIVIPAKGFYMIALTHNFVEGRQDVFVAAACLYVACRVHKRPFLLIDFAYVLKADMYVLGLVLVELIKVLHLEEHVSVMKPFDPSLFIHRFVCGLIGGPNREVERTALKIVTGLSYDWMQTGMNPSAVCGAAVYLSGLVHGFKFSKLSIEEFEQKTEQLEVKGNNYKDGELLCEHKGVAHFAHGLCGACYGDFVTFSSGLVDGFNTSETLALPEYKGSGVSKGNEALKRCGYADYIVTECDDESGHMTDAKFEKCIHDETKRFLKDMLDSLNHVKQAEKEGIDFKKDGAKVEQKLKTVKSVNCCYGNYHDDSNFYLEEEY